MKGGSSPHGYTIVEVMIFLAVTGALLASALLIFRGQSGRTEFATGAREMESRMQDIINDVSTGYYAHGANFTCTAGATGPTFSASTDEEGTNQDCIFIGRAPHFDLTGGANVRYNIYTIAGLRQAGLGVSKHEVEDFSEAKPRAIVSPVDLTQSEQLPPSMKFGTMFYVKDGLPQQIDAVAFFSSFSKYQNSSLQPGTMSVHVVPLAGGGAGGSSDQATIVSQIADLGLSAAPANMDPNGGVVVCFNSSGSNQYAKLTIGNWRARTTTNMEIKVGTCPLPPNLLNT